MGSHTVSPQPHVPSLGVWYPAATFFHHDTDSLVILGTNSEAFLLTREERTQLISTARAAVGPDFPPMAGVGAHSTKQTLELAQDADAAGANYLLVLPPAYFGIATNMNVVNRFFSEVAAKSHPPVVIYNFPGVCNGVDMDSETIAAIARDSVSAHASGRSNVVGVKLTCGSVGKITRLAASFAPVDFGGESDFLIGGLTAGSAGCIAAFANIFPKVTARIYALYQKGHIEEAVELQRKAALAETAINSGIASTKRAVACYSAQLAGIQDAAGNQAPRDPYEEVGEGAKPVTQQVMAEVAVIEKSL
ncbi:unnamed protein product [Penicillium nalgiovense]|nr:unnamed protein product [Penicillium nalgiovense]